MMTFDVVHAHNYYTLPLLAALPLPRKAVLTPPSTTPGVARRPPPCDSACRTTRLLAACSGASPPVACVSAAEAALVRRRLGIDDAVVVPNIVELAPSRRSRPWWPTATRRTASVLAVGRLEAYKGVGRLINCVPFFARSTSSSSSGTGPAFVASNGWWGRR